MIDQPFVIEDRFYRDLESLFCDLVEDEEIETDQEFIDSLENNWGIEVELCSLQKMFEVSLDDFDCVCERLADNVLRLCVRWGIKARKFQPTTKLKLKNK